MCSCSGGVTVASGCPALRRARSAKAPASSASVAAADSKASHHGLPRFPLVLGDPPQRRLHGAQPRLLRLEEVVAVGDHSPRNEQRPDAGIGGTQAVPLKPVQGGGRDNGVERAERRDQVDPSRRAQVGEHPRQTATVVSVRAPPEQHQHRVVVQSDHRDTGEAIESTAGQRTGPTTEIEDPPRRRGDRADDVEDHGEPLLAVGHVPLLLIVPTPQPRGSVDDARAVRRIVHRHSLAERGPRAPEGRSTSVSHAGRTREREAFVDA